jgi:hypothetical protein
MNARKIWSSWFSSAFIFVHLRLNDFSAFESPLAPLIPTQAQISSELCGQNQNNIGPR